MKTQVVEFENTIIAQSLKITRLEAQVEDQIVQIAKQKETIEHLHNKVDQLQKSARGEL